MVQGAAHPRRAQKRAKPIAKIIKEPVTKDTSSAIAPPQIGCVDFVSHEKISGWAWNPLGSE